MRGLMANKAKSAKINFKKTTRYALPEGKRTFS